MAIRDPGAGRAASECHRAAWCINHRDREIGGAAAPLAPVQPSLPASRGRSIPWGLFPWLLADAGCALWWWWSTFSGRGQNRNPPRVSLPPLSLSLAA